MTKNQPTRQAPEAESAAADGSESTRKRVSKRDFLAGGAVVDRIEQATGARYTLLAPSGNKDIDADFSTDSSFKTMCAIFGFHTKVGNVANTVLNDKDEPGTPDDAAAAIADFIAQAQDGTWAERAAGGVGARVDKDALADSIVHVRTAANAGDNGTRSVDRAAIRAALETPANVRAARQVEAIVKEYNSRVGKPTKSVDDLGF